MDTQEEKKKNRRKNTFPGETRYFNSSCYSSDGKLAIFQFVVSYKFQFKLFENDIQITSHQFILFACKNYFKSVFKLNFVSVWAKLRRS